jgi:hypothetical protein
MLNCWKELPLDLVRKILLYRIPSQSHRAYTTAKIRPIFNCELNSNLTEGKIKIVDDAEILNINYEDFVNGSYIP